MKRLKFLFATLALFMATSVMAGNVQYLVLDLADGTKTVIPLQDQPVITCQAGELQVKVAGEVTVSASLGDVAKYSFSDTTPTGIEQLVGEETHMEMGHVFIAHAREGEVVSVFTTDGRQVAVQRVGADGRADVDLSGLATGLYIVKTSKTSIKVMNR